MKHTLYVTLKVEVESDLPSLEDVIDELGSECDYHFAHTENVELTALEWLDTSTQNPL